MKKKTQRFRVPVTMALLKNWSVPIRRAPAGSTRPAKKSTVRIIQIAGSTSMSDRWRQRFSFEPM
jgi:hypothetical protein